MQSPPPYDKEIITQSLFSATEQTISEANIQKILDGEIELPDKVRIAIFKYGNPVVNRYYANYWPDEDYLKLQQSYLDTLIFQIQKSNRVERIFPIPSLMMSTQPNITELRESAVRLQADLLLVFTVQSDIDTKYNMFSKNLAKAFATCETILMDTRTGVIPHSDVITKDFFVKRESQDWSDTEMQKRAKNGAVMLSLGRTGEGIGQFLRRSE